jgi:PhnB protein
MTAAHQDMGHVQDPVDADRIAWGQVVSDHGFRVMAYDVPSGTAWEPGVNALFVSLRGKTSEEISAHWAKLSDGAKILPPLGPAPWAMLYGMLMDRFGVVWALDVVAPYPGADTH